MSTEEHIHVWKPSEGTGQYICECGATGYRPSSRRVGVSSEIVPHKQRKVVKGEQIHVGQPNMTTPGSARRGKRGPGEW